MAHANFLEVTQRFEDQVGDATSFIWACYSGLWKLHSEAKYLNEKLEVSNWKKAEDYLLGTVPKDGGVDLKEIAVRRTWAQHELAFERLMLVEMSVLYEDWCVQFCSIIEPTLTRLAEVLQFPSTSPRTRLPSSHPRSWRLWQVAIDAAPSTLIRDDYRPGLLARYQTAPTILDPLLEWYRFFKECRNTFVHSGGKHTLASVAAYARASAHSLKSLGLSRDLALASAPAVGESVQLGLKNAALGLAVVARLANAFDAALCHSRAAEDFLVIRLKETADAKKSSGKEISIPSAKPHLREKAIRSLLGSAMFPQPNSVTRTDRLLKQNGIFRV